MKFIITENKRDYYVDRMFDKLGISYETSFGGRKEVDYGDKIINVDTVYFEFSFPNNRWFTAMYRYNTIKNKVVSINSIHNIWGFTDDLEYFPKEILNGYLNDKGKEFLENMLPTKYPNDNI
jgi:hypothetical protein